MIFGLFVFDSRLFCFGHLSLWQVALDVFRSSLCVSFALDIYIFCVFAHVSFAVCVGLFLLSIQVCLCVFCVGSAPQFDALKVFRCFLCVKYLGVFVCIDYAKF